MKSVSPAKPALCKRPYSLGKRSELSARKRTAILAAARAQLGSNGFLSLTLDSLARDSGVTRQTIHNLFGTKAGLLEALFNQLAVDGGMHRMREVMQRTDVGFLLESFTRVFTDFWSKDRLFIRRIHGIAAIDSELGRALEARNQRRLDAASRVVNRVCGENVLAGQEDKTRKITALYALTSFEFFDILTEASGSVEDAAQQVLTLVTREFAK